MSLRSFFLWFWGIVFGSGVAAGATMAFLQTPAKAPEPSPVQPVAMIEPLPLPPVPTTGEPSAAPKPHVHVTAAHPSHPGNEPRRFAQLESPRITVVPPIPPAHATQTTGETMARLLRLPALRSPTRVEPRETVSAPPAPAPEPRPRAYAYARNYPRYSYSYTYYPYPYYSYPYSYSYAY